MRGKRKVPLHIKISSASAASKQKRSPKKSAKSKASDTYPSTLVTSPLSPSTTRKSKRTHTYEDGERNNYGYIGDGVVVPDDYDNDDDSDKDAFEPVASKRHRHATPQFGPPITTDERMSNLPSIHCLMVDNFVERAKELANKIRRAKNLRYPLFTEANFREMAIRWTTTLSEMSEIDGIQSDLVERYGKRFIPLVFEVSNHYEQMMRADNDQIATELNPIVVEISDDDVVAEDDENDDENENEKVDDDLDDTEKEAIIRAQQQSRYFQNQSNGPKSQSRTLPWNDKSRDGSTMPKRSSSKAGRGSFPRKGSSRRSSGRKSNASSGSGVSKKSRYSSSSKTSSTGVGSNQSGLMSTFGRKGGRGGGSGGGIGMMPT